MGRPRKEKLETVEVVQETVDVQTEDCMVFDNFSTNIPLEVELDKSKFEDVDCLPYKTQRDRVELLIDHLRGSGMQVMFDDDGVTFKRGVMVEFINYSSSDRLIVNAATRIARPA